MKVAVVGLDSADWSLLDGWLHHLPHIAAIRREGVSGRLATCKPPVTIPAWKCYATGKNPGKLGIYWFARPDFARRTLDLNLPGDLAGNLWDYIPKALVVNTPGTFPPRPIDGVLIAGFPCPDGLPFASPPWVQAQVNGYRVNARVPPGHPEFPEAAVELMRGQFAAFRRLAPRFDFGQVTAFHIDELHHLYGSDSLVLDAWRFLDEEIGKIMDLADNVVLVSDHGSGPMQYSVNVAPTLLEEGLLRLRRDPWRGPLAAAQRLVEVLPPSAYRAARDRFIPAKLQDAVRSRLQPINDWLPAAGDQLRTRIDWSSPIIPLNQGLMYRNPSSGGNGHALGDARARLAKLPGVARVWRREEMYTGPLADRGPDLWLEGEPGVEFVARYDEDWVTRRPERGHGWIVNHRSEGIFGFYGKDVEPAPIDRASIYDMCPTLLAFFGIAPPSSVDGTVLPVVPPSLAGGRAS